MIHPKDMAPGTLLTLADHNGTWVWILVKRGKSDFTPGWEARDWATGTYTDCIGQWIPDHSWVFGACVVHQPGKSKA